MRKAIKAVLGKKTVDGAGVSLTRVLGSDDVLDFDPFLLLDSFDSTCPDDYTKGFPMHPHRGIETITYLIEGEIEYSDCLGNKGAIRSGESQWLTAGSGVLHQEMPKESRRMLGLQIWLNLPKEHKMADPAHLNISRSMIGLSNEDFGTVRVIAGCYHGACGITPPYISASIYDVSIKPGKEALLDTTPYENVFVFLILGDALIDGKTYREKTAVLFGKGSCIKVTAAGAPCRFLLFSAASLWQPVAWGGPIVMNDEEELETAFSELINGTFLKGSGKISSNI